MFSVRKPIGIKEYFMQVIQKNDIPIYKNHHLSLIEMRKMYGLQVASFAKLANINETQVREGEPSTSVRNKVKYLEKIIILLWKVTEGNEKQIKFWLSTPADEYFGLTPVEFMQLDKGNPKTVFHNLQQAIYGEVMGA